MTGEIWTEILVAHHFLSTKDRFRRQAELWDREFHVKPSHQSMDLRPTMMPLYVKAIQLRDRFLPPPDKRRRLVRIVRQSRSLQERDKQIIATPAQW